MLLRRVVAPYLQANCWVLAPDGARHALVVDPGAGSADDRSRRAPTATKTAVATTRTSEIHACRDRLRAVLRRDTSAR